MQVGGSRWRGLTATLLLAVLDSVWAHVDLALLPCDPQDEMQLWNMGTRGMGYGGVLIHQSTKLCLIPLGCDVEEGTPLVLDDCTSSCVASHPESGKFTLHHNSGAMPRVLEISGITPALVTSALNGAPVLSLSRFDSSAPDHQQWTSKMPYKGPDHTMQVGRAKDGEALCDAKSGDCCLAAQIDVVPDGDGGWVFIVVAAVGAALYVFGGLYVGQRRTGRLTHIHIEQGQQVWGLVQDGCAFTMAVYRGEGGRRSAGGDARNADSSASTSDVEAATASAAQTSSVVRAERGRPTPLHYAASAGNASKLQDLLAGKASVDINSGDSRQYTPFAAACAGGHVDCVSALLEAGCDTQRACDTGLTGWELARDLKRHEVLALQPQDSTGTTGRAGASTSAKTASKKRSSSKRSSASAGKQWGSKADERAAPLLPKGTSKVVL